MRIEFAGSARIAEGTMAFHFERERRLRFKAGQFGEFTFPSPAPGDAQDNTRTFSLAGSPDSQQLMIATRMSASPFKQRLRDLPVGACVEFSGPMGNFTLPEDPARPVVFLAGGIGVTPVRSMVEWATNSAPALRLIVLYSNRTRATAAFLGEFREWERANPNLTFVPTLTEGPPEPDFEHGRIDEAMLRRYVEDPRQPFYYVVGPPAMVSASKALVERIGAERIRVENFIGY